MLISWPVRRATSRNASRSPGPQRPALLSWLALGVVLAGCGGGGGHEPTDSVPGTVPLVAPGHWVVLGSSTAAGVGAPAGAGWAALLATQWQARAVTLDNLARGQLQSSQALPVGTALPAGRPAPDPGVNIDAALARSPVLVILSFPTNDAVAGVPAADTVAAWRTLRDRATAGGAATVVLGTQPRASLSPGQAATLVDTDRLAAEAFGPCFLPLREALAGPDGAPAPAYSAGDGIHLNAAGHAWLHEQLSALLAAGRCVRTG